MILCGYRYDIIACVESNHNQMLYGSCCMGYYFCRKLYHMKNTEDNVMGYYNDIECTNSFEIKILYIFQ